MAILRVLPFAALLLLVPSARAGDGLHGPSACVEESEFVILAAQWGTGDRFADVTQEARALATERGLDVAAERAHFGDPYPWFKKSLVVFYVWRGEVRSATAPEHGRLRIPPDEARDASTRRAWLSDRLEAHRVAARRRLDAAIAKGTPDAVRKAVRQNSRAARRFARRHARDLGDDGAALALRIRAFARDARRALRNLHETEVEVSASSDWRHLGVEVGPGDVVAVAAEGEWTLGTWAGSCDATGLSGDRYRTHSTVEELRHGCLLVRVASNLFVGGASHGALRVADEGLRVEAKCNDETYRDNGGAITLRVLVAPAARRDAAAGRSAKKASSP